MDFGKYLNMGLEKFKGLSMSQKLGIGIGVSFLVVALIVSSAYLMKPNYVLFMSDLVGSDASAVKERLSELGVPFDVKSENDGTISIYVPEERKDMARVDVSSSFVSTMGAVGYESLSVVSFGESESDKEMKRKIALEGELVRTLQSLPMVKSARVHITMPKSSLFAVDRDAATATVTLELSGGSVLTQAQVRGIMQMVANGVNGLDPANVAVFDQSAVDLSQQALGAAAGGSAVAGDEVSKEREIEMKVLAMLEKVVGPENVDVAVDLVLNYDQVEIVEEVLGDSVPVSEQLVERSSSYIDGLGDLPGVDSNADIDGYQTVTASSEVDQSEEYSESLTNYEIEKKNIHTVVAQGDTERMTISVLLNQSSVLDDSGNINQDLVDQLTAGAKRAAGFSDERSDEISVVVAPFDTSHKAMEEEALKSANVKTYILYGVYAVIILGLGFLAFMIVRRVAATGLLKVEDFAKLVKTPVGSAVSTKEIDYEPIAASGGDLIEEKIGSISDNEPQTVATILRHLMVE